MDARSSGSRPSAISAWPRRTGDDTSPWLRRTAPRSRREAVQFVSKNIGWGEDFEVADADGNPKLLAENGGDAATGVDIQDAGLPFERAFYISRDFNEDGTHGTAIVST